MAMDAHNATRPTLRVIFAFLHGVALGIFWEGISMGVLVAATLVEHACGELAMVGVFWGAACAMYYISHRVDLLWPLLGILLFRLSAQLAMGVTTGSVLLTTLVAETPACTSDRIRDAAWRGPLLRILRPLLPRRALRRVYAIDLHRGYGRRLPRFTHDYFGCVSPKKDGVPGYDIYCQYLFNVFARDGATLDADGEVVLPEAMWSEFEANFFSTGGTALPMLTAARGRARRCGRSCPPSR